MNEVVITGIGAVSSYGSKWDDLAAADESSKPNWQPWPATSFLPREGAMLGLVQSYDRTKYLPLADQRIADKFAALSVLAAGDALESAGLLHEGKLTADGDHIATFIGTARPEFGGFIKFGVPVLSGQVTRTNPVLFPYMARSVACGQICMTFGLRGYSTNLSAGPLSALHAIARAWTLLRTGRAEIALVGGSECLSKDALRNSRNLDRAYFANPAPCFFGDASGLPVPAEGATFLVMETLASARRRDRTPTARVSGAVMGRFKQKGLASDCVEVFEERILTKLDVNWRDVGLVSCGATGKGDHADVLETQILEAVGRSKEHSPAVTACRSLTGDAEAASSAMQVALAAAALSGGGTVPTMNVSPSTPLNVLRKRTTRSMQTCLISGIDRAKAYAYVTLATL